MPGTLLKAAPGIYIDPFERKDIAAEVKGNGADFVLLDDYGIKRLGLTPHSRKSLQRLYLAGMITMYRVTPGRFLLKLSSWHQHLERVEQDPDYWDRDENIKKWRVAILST